jgi:hypothetical protein
MKTVVAWMNPKAPAPAGGGTTEGWFEYYKLPEEGEVWLPFHPDVDIKVGDTLWFLMGSRPIGNVRVLRTDRDNSNGWLEVWYEAKDVKLTKAATDQDVTYLLKEVDYVYPLWDPRMYR